MEYATIFDIQRMSLHDGPGIRTTVFFKGCGLRCFWCHNPESLQVSPQLLFYPDRCIGCRLCEQVCPKECHSFTAGESGVFEHILKRESCISCGACARACPAKCLQLSGYRASLEDVLAQVTRDLPFYKSSGGGVTVSGGEPLLQAPFVSALFRALKKKGIHTAIETALHVPASSLEMVLPFTDLVIADMKHPDPEMHRQFTGSDNRRILDNFALLQSSDVPYMIRIPVIPGVNDTPEVMRAFEANMLPLTRRQCVELMPWHDFGLNKYAGLSLGTESQAGLQTPSKEKLLELGRQFQQTSVIFRDGASVIRVTGG